MKLKIPLTEFERSVFQKLCGETEKTYIVGGAVRDTILGKQKNDADLSTSLLPDETMKLFENVYTINPKGLFFGTVEIKFSNESVEVTTLKEKITVDELGVEVEFGESVERDALYRDFTINAIYVDCNWNVIDPLGGIKDLKSMILRPTPTYRDRLITDPVLAFRTARFVAQGYKPTKELIEVLSNPDNHVHMKIINPSRLARETRKALSSNFREYLRFLHETGALYYQFRILEKYKSAVEKALEGDDVIGYLYENAIDVLQLLHVPPQVYMKNIFKHRKRRMFTSFRY